MRTDNSIRHALLTADGGSTKTDWCWVVEGEEPAFFRTRGLNPALQDLDGIRAVLRNELWPQLESRVPDGAFPQTDIHYYGAGCIPSECPKMEQALTNIIPESTAHAYSDLLGAARALCGHDAGIACILGTGSNACLYDGKAITRRVPSLGYIMGDEGSGTALGKRLIGDWLKGLLDEDLCEALGATYSWSESDIIRKVYREPEANRFLASFTPFIAAHRSAPAIHRILTDCFEAFFSRNVMACHTDGEPIPPVHFVGGIATTFRAELEETASAFGFRIGRTMKEPIEGMAKYHTAEVSWNALRQGD